MMDVGAMADALGVIFIKISNPLKERETKCGKEDELLVAAAAASTGARRDFTGERVRWKPAAAAKQRGFDNRLVGGVGTIKRPSTPPLG